MTLPEVGWSRPAMQCINVDLPEPDGPMDRGHFTTGEIDAEMVERPDLGVVGTVGLDQIDRARHYGVAI